MQFRNMKFNKTTYFLFIAIDHNNCEIFKLLFTHPKIDINKKLTIYKF